MQARGILPLDLLLQRNLTNGLSKCQMSYREEENYPYLEQEQSSPLMLVTHIPEPARLGPTNLSISQKRKTVAFVLLAHRGCISFDKIA